MVVVAEQDRVDGPDLLTDSAGPVVLRDDVPQPNE